jgi:hypothetical protein
MAIAAQRDWLLLAEAVPLVARVRLALTLSSLQRVRARLAASPRRAKRLDAGVVPLAMSVRRASRIVPGATCLTQAIALQEMLGRRGIASVVRLGVREEQPDVLAAHAWLTVDGRIVLGGSEAALARFSPIAELGPVSR